jgi:hypothetical protein
MAAEQLLFTSEALQHVARERWWFVVRVMEIREAVAQEQQLVVFRAPNDGSLLVEQFFLRCLDRMGFVKLGHRDDVASFLLRMPTWLCITAEDVTEYLTNPSGFDVRGLALGGLQGEFIGAQRAGWPVDSELVTYVVAKTDREFLGIYWMCSG